MELLANCFITKDLEKVSRMLEENKNTKIICRGCGYGTFLPHLRGKDEIEFHCLSCHEITTVGVETGVPTSVNFVIIEPPKANS